VKTPAVFANELSLGVFLATIALFSTTLADTISELNNQMLSVIQAFTPLKDLTRYMNLETTLPQLKKITTHRNTLTKLQRQHTFAKVAMASDGDEAAFKTDHINIEISDLCYEFVKGQPVLQHVNLSIAQGQLVSVTGGPRTGKSTFMELLAHSRHPTDGSIMVPSHLRLLHVHQEPMFLRASIFSNLCLGLPAREPVDIDRIFAILQMCGLAEITDLVHTELKLDEAKKEHKGSAEVEDDDHHTILVDDQDEDGKAYTKKKRTPTPESTPRDSSSARGIRNSRMNEGIKFEKKNKVRAKWETFLTHSQKSKLYICCALISNPNVMLMTKTLDSLHDHSATEMLDVLFQHVKNRGLCLPEESINSRRPLIVFYSTDRTHLAVRGDTILRITEEMTVNVVPKEDFQHAKATGP
jgi:ATPase subunit of ABC transporter with duplicated ATPase domains